MRLVRSHPWDLSFEEARALQRACAQEVVEEDCAGPVRIVAGADIAYDPESDRLVAAVVALDAESLEPIERVFVEDRARFPYIPGFLSFREVPAIAKALEKLKAAPDLIVCDGQGVAHPRGFGVACHLGLLFDVPTIGCGKTRLIGEAEEPGEERGDWSPLTLGGREIGRVLRTRRKTRPVFVSVGHKISLSAACDWVLRLAPKYRLPETTRQADGMVRALMTKIRQRDDAAGREPG